MNTDKPLSSRALLLSSKSALKKTVGAVMRGTDARAKDAIADIAANSSHVWDYPDWTAALAALESCDVTVADWLLTR